MLGDSNLLSPLHSLPQNREWIRRGNYHPPWQGLKQSVQVERFDQNRSSCAELSVVRTIYHRRILIEKGKGKKEGNQWESAEARCVCFTHNKQTRQTQNTFFSRIKLMHLALFLLGTMTGVPIRVSQRSRSWRLRSTRSTPNALTLIHLLSEQ